MFKTIVVTGGAGFIGSNFIRHIFSSTDFKGLVINLDCLTYAGNLDNLKDISNNYGPDRYQFYRIDIRNFSDLKSVFSNHSVDAIVNFAAETHVDRSIIGPSAFVETNINGTFNLLECAKDQKIRFHQISTDEVYGSLKPDEFFYETTAYDPRSPYSASKAAADHLVGSYFHTFGLPVTIGNCSNNYGAYQFPEKLIPLMIQNMLKGLKLPVYGDGQNIRDWLHVDDHSSATWAILNHGKLGESYNIGGDNQLKNLDLIHNVAAMMAQKMNTSKDKITSLISFVADRPGHDRRYAVNCDKIKRSLSWKQKYNFESGLQQTVDWYFNNQDWISKIADKSYLQNNEKFSQWNKF